MNLVIVESYTHPGQLHRNLRRKARISGPPQAKQAPIILQRASACCTRLVVYGKCGNTFLSCFVRDGFYCTRLPSMQTWNVQNKQYTSCNGARGHYVVQDGPTQKNCSVSRTAPNAMEEPTKPVNIFIVS